jgi:hypothetical protein
VSSSLVIVMGAAEAEGLFSTGAGKSGEFRDDDDILCLASTVCSWERFVNNCFRCSPLPQFATVKARDD